MALQDNHITHSNSNRQLPTNTKTPHITVSNKLATSPKSNMSPPSSNSNAKREESEETFTQNQPSDPKAQLPQDIIEKLKFYPRGGEFMKSISQKNLHLDFAGGKTELDWAIVKGDSEVVKVLLDHNWRSQYNLVGGIIYLAASGYRNSPPDKLEQYEKTLTVILQHPSVDINSKDKFGDTILHQIITSGDLNLIKILLEHHADPNIINNCNKTPFQIAQAKYDAAPMNEKKQIEQILENNANRPGSLGIPVLPEEKINQKIADAKVLIANQAKEDLKIVQLLRQYGAKKPEDYKDPTDQQPLKIPEDLPLVQKEPAPNKESDDSHHEDGSLVIIPDTSNTKLEEPDKLVNTAPQDPPHKEPGQQNTPATEQKTPPKACDIFSLCTKQPLENDDWSFLITMTTHHPDMIDLKDEDGKTALHISTEARNLPMTTWIIDNQHTKKIINLKDKNGKTALHISIDAGDNDTTMLLLKNNAAVDIQDNDGKTAVHYLAQARKLDEMKLVIEKGADLRNIKDKDGKTVLDNIESYSPDMQALLNSADKTYANAQIYEVAKKGTPQQMDDLIAKGADIKQMLNGTTTALHLAVQNKNQSMVEFLVAHGVDIEMTNRSGQTALHTAALTGDWQIVDFLLERGANINQQDKFGNTPLHVIAQAMGKNFTLTILESLLEKGANINQQDNVGNTPLHAAAQHGNRQMVEFLLQRGADIKMTNNNGQTASQVAQAKKQTNIADLIDKALQKQNELQIPEDLQQLVHKPPSDNGSGNHGEGSLATQIPDASNAKLEEPPEQNSKNITGAAKNERNINQKNTSGNTLLYKNADLNSAGQGQKTASQVAKANNYNEIAGILKQPMINQEETQTSSPSTETTSLFSISGICSGIWSFFTSFWSGGNSSDVGEGHSNHSTAHESNHSEESNTSWPSWLGSLFKGLWPRKSQDASTKTPDPAGQTDKTTLHNASGDTTPTVFPTDEEMIQQIMAKLPGFPLNLPNDDEPHHLGDQPEVD